MTDTLGAREWQGTDVPAPGTYVLDPSHTTVGFVARHLMVTKVRGRFEEFEGSITVGDDPLASSAQAAISTASLTTGSPDRDGHVKSDDFLAVETFPTMRFASRRVSHVAHCSNSRSPQWTQKSGLTSPVVRIARSHPGHTFAAMFLRARSALSDVRRSASVCCSICRLFAR